MNLSVKTWIRPIKDQVFGDSRGSGQPGQPNICAGPKADDGQAVVEAALTLPLIAAFAFAVIEICLAFYTYCMISESAREGSRFAIVRGASCQTAGGASCTTTATSVSKYVTSLGFPNLGGGTMSASTTYPDGNANPGSRVQVAVSYVFPYSVPFAPKGSIHMSATSVMYIVQ